MLIYRITNEVNGKVYIGQTVDLPARIWQHRNPRAGVRPTLVQQAIQKHGWRAFKVDIVATADTPADLNRLEVELIGSEKAMDRRHGYNLTAGGYGARGAVRGTSTRELMATAAKARVTDEYRAMMSEKTRGKPKSQEHKEKTRLAANARPTARIVEFNGERLNVAEWARRIGITKEGLKFRLDKGMPVAEALTRPVGRWAPC